jgi:hypothetical protein
MATLLQHRWATKVPIDEISDDAAQPQRVIASTLLTPE